MTMEDLQSSRDLERDRKSRRRESDSEDSDQARQRRRRRRDEASKHNDSRDRDRDRRDRDRDRHRDRERDSHRDRARDRHDDRRRDRRRRSRSPESSRRRSDYDSKPRQRGSHSPPRSRDHELQVYDKSSEVKAGRKRDGPLPSQEVAFSKDQNGDGELGEAEKPEKEKPNFAPSGLLAAATNTIYQADGSAIVLKYHEPPEARKPPPKDEWKLYVFKGPDIVDTIDLSTRSCWLVGRELSVVDLPAEHPSISKQHAVIQFRYIEKRNEYGDKLGKVRPYLIDLDSANGTTLNKDPVPGSRYLELRDKDMVQFGHSTREYVLMLAPKI